MTSDFKLKIASLNCRGLNKKIKRKHIFTECLKYDIVCLQETYITDNTFKEWTNDWTGKLIYSAGTAHSKGQIILINKNTKLEDSLEIFFKTDRLLGIHIIINEVKYSIINVYGPNKKDEKNKFINSLYAAFNSTHPENLIICGDFNIVVDNCLDIISGEKHQASEVKMLNDFVHNCDLVDCWREKNGNDNDFTWSKSTPFIARSLD